MDMPDTLFTDPRFLEVMRLLKNKQAAKEISPLDIEPSDDEATRRVQAKINLRMKQRKSKR